MTLTRIVLLSAAATLAIAQPAAAQHQGHHMPGMAMPKPAAKKPAAKKPAAKKPVAKKKAAPKKAAVRKPAAKKSTPAPAKATEPMTGHEGHDMSAPTTATGHEGHDMSAPSTATGHEGHDMSQMPATSGHEGHDMTAMEHGNEGTALPAGNAPPPPVPTDHAADAVYGADAMAMGRHHLDHFHGAQNFAQLMANQAEVKVGDGHTGYAWDIAGWYGGDINRIWVKSEGEGEFGGPVEEAEVQALYSRAVGPYLNLQGGVRYDIRPRPNRVYATIGAEGLAPGFFDVEGALFLSNKGELMARLEGSYDQRITQRLILQPSVELNLAAQNSREIGVGSGLSDAELGLRLRYEIRREPYVGVEYQRAFGATRRYLRDEGEDAGGFSFVTGVRLWF